MWNDVYSYFDAKLICLNYLYLGEKRGKFHVGWHSQLIHLNIHSDWSRNVFFFFMYNFKMSYNFLIFLSDFHNFCTILEGKCFSFLFNSGLKSFNLPFNCNILPKLVITVPHIKIEYYHESLSVLVQWNLVIKSSDISNPLITMSFCWAQLFNFFLVYFIPDITRNLIYNKVIVVVPRTLL